MKVCSLLAEAVCGSLSTAGVDWLLGHWPALLSFLRNVPTLLHPASASPFPVTMSGGGLSPGQLLLTAVPPDTRETHIILTGHHWPPLLTHDTIFSIFSLLCHQLRKLGQFKHSLYSTSFACQASTESLENVFANAKKIFCLRKFGEMMWTYPLCDCPVFHLEKGLNKTNIPIYFCHFNYRSSAQSGYFSK